MTGFVLIDRLIEIQPGRSAVAATTFPPELPLFRDHFPGRPIVPGVLLTEAMCQTSGWMLAVNDEFRRMPLITRIDRATFSRPVQPGEPLTVRSELRGSHDAVHEVIASVSAGDETVASARLLFHSTDFETGGPGAETRDWTQATFARLGGPAAVRNGRD